MIRTVIKFAALLACSLASAAAAAETINQGRFGPVTLYRSEADPRDVVLFLSGDGGWNLGVISMAERLTAKGAVVAGIDGASWMTRPSGGGCATK